MHAKACKQSNYFFLDTFPHWCKFVICALLFAPKAFLFSVKSATAKQEGSFLKVKTNLFKHFLRIIFYFQRWKFYYLV